MSERQRGGKGRGEERRGKGRPSQGQRAEEGEVDRRVARTAAADESHLKELGTSSLYRRTNSSSPTLGAPKLYMMTCSWGMRTATSTANKVLSEPPSECPVLHTVHSLSSS
eukprot:765480-Hanusia_phi.AAC.1